MEGMLIVQSDNWLNLIKRNFPQSNVARPNKSKVTVTVFGNFYEEKNTVSPPTSPTNSHISTQENASVTGKKH